MQVFIRWFPFLSCKNPGFDTAGRTKNGTELVLIPLLVKPTGVRGSAVQARSLLTRAVLVGACINDGVRFIPGANQLAVSKADIIDILRSAQASNEGNRFRLNGSKIIVMPCRACGLQSFVSQAHAASLWQKG